MRNAINLTSDHNNAIRAEIGDWLRVLLSKEQPGLPPRVRHLLDCLRALDATGDRPQTGDCLNGPPQLSARSIIFDPAFSLMPRYFFNVHDERSNLDTEGEELPNDEAAWREATIVAGEMCRNIDGKFRPGQEWRLEVTDEGRILFISFASMQKRFNAA